MMGKDITFTEECLLTALLLLMKQKPYEDITVTELAQKAGVSRMSYYRLYKSKDDILIRKFQAIFGEFLEQIREEPQLDKCEFVLKLFRVCQKYYDVMDGLLNARLYHLILRNYIETCTYMTEHVFHMDIQDEEVDYWIYGMAGKFALVINRWVEKGMKESPEEMAAFIMEKLI